MFLLFNDMLFQIFWEYCTMEKEKNFHKERNQIGQDLNVNYTFEFV